MFGSLSPVKHGLSGDSFPDMLRIFFFPTLILEVRDTSEDFCEPKELGICPSWIPSFSMLFSEGSLNGDGETADLPPFSNKSSVFSEPLLSPALHLVELELQLLLLCPPLQTMLCPGSTS